MGDVDDFPDGIYNAQYIGNVRQGYQFDAPFSSLESAFEFRQ